jgi:hypothetical protein
VGYGGQFWPGATGPVKLTPSPGPVRRRAGLGKPLLGVKYTEPRPTPTLVANDESTMNQDPAYPSTTTAPLDLRKPSDGLLTALGSDLYAGC